MVALLRIVRFWLFGLFLVPFAVSGCAQWSNLSQEIKAPERGSLLRPASDDTAPVEVILLRLGTEQAEALESVWSRTHEQAFSIDLRRRLDQNGIRIGVIDASIPLALQSMIDAIEKRLNEDPLEQVGVGADVPSHSRLLQCRLGQRKEVFIGSKRRDSLVLLHNTEGAARGRSFEEPQLLFDLRAYPRGDGTTQLSLTPEIQHGQVKQKFVNQEYAIRRELKRDSVQWTELAIEHAFQPGQTLMMSASQPPRGLGEPFFFTETAAGTREQLLMLVRIGASRLDSAFAEK